MKLVVIDYDAGNVESVINALNHIKNKEEIILSNQISDIKSATHLLLPGVSSFGETMSGLKAIKGLLSAIKNHTVIEKKPFLGICAGMQVLADVGYEDGQHQGLGFISGKVERISAPSLKIPHMGWNDVAIEPNSHALLDGITSGEHFYFANSYHFICQNKDDALAQVEYGGKMACIIAKENIFGTQFHPEKSGAAGLKLLNNFLKLYPFHLKKQIYDEAFLSKNHDGECRLYQVIQPNSPSEFLPKNRGQGSASSGGMGI
ncbi:MAG: imidazole glycerol phosphate synthase subunit HisH [Alphaproteobacteria bacterium]|nr:imidazole glycerol phosphate synthase subunit HisH [Alphaproteobacteria bacterium]